MRRWSKKTRAISLVCIGLQLHSLVLLGAEPVKTGDSPKPPTAPSEENIVRVVAQQLGRGINGDPSFLLATDLSSDAQVQRLRPPAPDRELIRTLKKWLSQFPKEEGKVPAALLELDPTLQAKVDEGLQKMAQHYSEIYVAVDAHHAALPDVIAESERRLLQLIKQARQYREAKIREFEARLLAAEATRRRTGIPPEVSRQLLESQTLLTSLEEALHRQNLNLHGALTQYFKDETNLRNDTKIPLAVLKLWAEETKKTLASATKEWDRHWGATTDAENGFYEYTQFGLNTGKYKIPTALHTPAGVWFAKLRLTIERTKHEGLKKLVDSSPATPLELLGELQTLRSTTSFYELAWQAKSYSEFKSGALVIPIEHRNGGMPQRVDHPWLTALGWYREGLIEKAQAAGKPGPSMPTASSRTAALRFALGIKADEIKKPGALVTDEKKSARSSLGRRLAWTAAIGVGIAASIAGGRYAAPHLGLSSLNPFSASARSASDAFSFADSAAVGQNFDLGGSGDGEGNVEAHSRSLYLLRPGTETNLEKLPTHFEFAYLNERNGALAAFSFKPAAGHKAQFELTAQKGALANHGWIAIASVPGFETHAEIKNGDKVLREGTDYKIYRTASGALLAQIYSTHQNAPLHVNTAFFQKTERSPLPDKDLQLTHDELAALLRQADLMEKEGLTEWAKTLRSRGKQALDGKSPLKVTDLPALLADGTFYPQVGRGKIQAPLGSNPWSILRDLPREEGKLVGQCSVSETALRRLIELAAPRFADSLFPMNVETRDSDSPQVGKEFGHRYTVLRIKGFDPVAMDATSGEMHPKYAAPRTSVASDGSYRPLHTLGYAAGGILAVGGAAWYLRRRLRPLTESEKREAALAAQELEKAKSLQREAANTARTVKQAKAAAADVMKPHVPSPEEIALAQLKSRNAHRQEQARELELLTDRMVAYADSLGADPGRRDRSLPLPTVAQAARLLREFALGQTEHDTEAKMVSALAGVFRLSLEQVTEAQGDLSKVVSLGADSLEKTRAAYLALHPEAKDAPDHAQPLFQEMVSSLKYMAQQKWTAREREPLLKCGEAFARL